MNDRLQFSGNGSGSQGPPPCFSVATYNIHRCVGRDRRRDPDRIAQVIQEIGADIIGLQELDFRPFAHSKSCRLDDIIEATGLNVVYGYTLPQHNGRYGNALLTSHKVVDVRRINLSVPGREPRGAIDVDLEVHGNHIRVIATHLGLRAYERKHQIRRLLDLLSKEEDRLIIMLGDFNEWTPMSRRVRWLCNHLGKCPSLRTFPSAMPFLALDRIYVRPVESVIEVKVHISPVARIASDHLPLKAIIASPNGCGFEAPIAEGIDA